MFFGDLQWPKQLNAPLESVDPEIFNIIELEKARQWKVLSLSLSLSLARARSLVHLILALSCAL